MKIRLLFEKNSKLLWSSDKNSIKNIYAYFRSEFSSNNRSEKAILRIYAKDLYELYFNESFIANGPCKSEALYIFMMNLMLLTLFAKAKI